jgi:hypothetical protein
MTCNGPLRRLTRRPPFFPQLKNARMNANSVLQVGLSVQTSSATFLHSSLLPSGLFRIGIMQPTGRRRYDSTLMFQSYAPGDDDVGFVECGPPFIRPPNEALWGERVNNRDRSLGRYAS